MPNDYRKHAEVLSVQCNRTQRGRLRSVKVRVEYFEYQSDPEGESVNHRNGENIRFRFKPSSERYFVLESWKDASDNSGWVNSRVLRCLPAAVAAAEAVPDVEAVESVDEQFALEMDLGRQAFQNAQEEQ